MKALITIETETIYYNEEFWVNVEPFNQDGTSAQTATLPFRILQIMKDRKYSRLNPELEENLQRAKKLLEKLGWEVIVDL